MTESAPAERLFRGHSGRLLLVVSLGWFAIQTGRLVVSPLLPDIQNALRITSAEAGFALTAMWGLYALAQYPSGRLSDQLSRKTLLLTGLVAILVGFLALAAAPVYALFVLAAAAVGLGAGCYPVAARALVSDLFVEKRGRAFGLHSGAGDLGGVAAAGLATLVLAYATWRAAFLPIAAVLAVVVVTYALWSAESLTVARTDLAVAATARRILGDAQLRWLLLTYALYAFTWQSAAGFLPTYLRAKDFSPLVANAAFAVLFGVGTLVKPAAGTLSDRVPRDHLTPVTLALAALSLAGIVLAQTPIVAVAAVVAFAVGLMAYPPIMQAYLMDSFPDESAGGDLGAMRTVYLAIGATGPTFVGVVHTQASYDLAFACLVAALATGAVILVALARKQ
ncbi:MFS transporter [Halocalculus aciditolerans]|uniref:MFS transporter n=1 Tax=Halocalculus aciditolerans TaxID=1383812 RepID=A0A830F7F8_9EURY|nr:MFS transporter [Halocalculus aciditolerans]GGL47071.1 MFS transporter [Halocalculus aciditolerans]